RERSGFNLRHHGRSFRKFGEKAEALAAWKNCLAYARSEERDEDIWIGKARQRLG
ncbi:MAG: hypothetical protein HC849_05495, partial [Oscillatoriales cyanobacterium RU_3_3]|nr:hypothetical protein [Oscillatoriales cyanobacterium RU_3_3]